MKSTKKWKRGLRMCALAFISDVHRDIEELCRQMEADEWDEKQPLRAQPLLASYSKWYLYWKPKHHRALRRHSRWIRKALKFK